MNVSVAPCKCVCVCECVMFSYDSFATLKALTASGLVRVVPQRP